MKLYLNTIFVLMIFQLSFINTSLNFCQLIKTSKNKKCKLISYEVYHFKMGCCFCPNVEVELKWTNLTFQTLKEFSQSFEGAKIIFENKKPVILDSKQQIFDQSFFNLSFFVRDYEFHNVKGFDVNSFNNSITLDSSTGFSFSDSSSLAFYSNGRRLKTCQDFPSQIKSIFQIFDVSYSFSDKKYQPVCPLAFSNSNFIRWLTFSGLVNTFLKTNIVKFLDLPKNMSNVSFNIDNLYLTGCCEIKLNQRIINLHMFKHTKLFLFELDIIEIEKGLFKSLLNVQDIIMFIDTWSKCRVRPGCKRAHRQTHLGKCHVGSIHMTETDASCGTKLLCNGGSVARKIWPQCFKTDGASRSDCGGTGDQGQRD